MNVERRIRSAAKTILAEGTSPKLKAAYEAAYGYTVTSRELDTFRVVLRALAEMPNLR